MSIPGGSPSGEVPTVPKPEAPAPKTEEVKPPETQPLGQPEKNIVNRIKKDGNPDSVLEDIAKPADKNVASPASETQKSGPEIKKQREKAQSEGTQLIQALLEKGIITNQPSKDEKWGYRKDYTVDTDGAIKLLESMLTSQEEYKGLPEEQKIEIQQRCQALFSRVVDTFTNNGVLPESLVPHMSRLILPQNIQITDEDYHRFLYLKSEFPHAVQDNAELQIGTKQLRYMEDQLRKKMYDAGASLSDEQIRNVALRWSMSHEYGHAIDRVVKLVHIERTVLTDPQEEIWKVAQEVETTMEDDLINNIAPDQEMKSMLTVEPPDGVHVHQSGYYSERFASGYEHIGLRQALTDEGLTASQVDSILEAFSLDYRDRIEQLNDLVKSSRVRGINIESLGGALTDLSIELREKGRSDLRDRMPLSFGIRNFGYYKPLSPDQLRSYTRKYTNV